jgi:hypothetical protein
VKNCLQKKNGKKESLLKAVVYRQKHQMERGIKEGICAAGNVFMPNHLVSAGQPATFAFAFRRFAANKAFA